VLALARLLMTADFWQNAGVTVAEIAFALGLGGSAGLLAGLILGGSRFLGEAYAPYLTYLGPTPKIIFLPVMIMAFGVGSGSKIAMGALSCFFPIALSTVAGMRGVDHVLIRVGRSFRLSGIQMATKIYLPAMRASVLNGIRLGFGVAVIGVLLAETKLSSHGLGYLIIQSYARFDMPQMYALLIIVFAFAVALNAVLDRFSEAARGYVQKTNPGEKR
jgi:ABC-type nitrate/sulfonate/bicarbonate transport system permease component